MVNSMRLAFVVPAYNEEASLEGCLRSILDQTGCDQSADTSMTIEIIVVNNASTDRTREVALAHAGVTVVDEPRKGLTFARQAGLLAAGDADLIANVDADSRLTPGWVTKAVSAFAQDRELVCLSGPLVYYDLPRGRRLLVHVFYLMAFASYAVNRWVFRVGSMVQGGNFVVRREALERIGGFDTTIAFYGEDTDIARRMVEVGRVSFSLGFRMLSSGRRLRHEGTFTMAARYTANYLSTIFLKRPTTQEYIDIREA
jgi:glycosyltransferase involved in cell wall biosynthesis